MNEELQELFALQPRCTGDETEKSHITWEGHTAAKWEMVDSLRLRPPANTSRPTQSWPVSCLKPQKYNQSRRQDLKFRTFPSETRVSSFL